jgi:UPF0716 family protein affecting phage T7 exclusion
MERPTPHREPSLALLLVATLGAALALALAALVAGGGATVAILAFAATAGFGLAADARAETFVRARRTRR